MNAASTPVVKPSRLLLQVTAFFAFMVLVLAAIGSGAGSVELLIWGAVLVAGIAVLVRRHRKARLGIG